MRASEAAVVGILGAGQLSQMLVQSSGKAGVRVHVYASSSTDSAAQEPDALVTLGSLGDRDVLKQFLSQVTVCGFESELIDCASLRTASVGLPIRFVPQLDVMERLSEKTEQKRILRNLGIPTAPFVEGPVSEAGLDPWFFELQRRFGSSFVVKWSSHGYDGRGVFLVSDDSSLKSARASCKMALARNIQLYAEAKVPFVRELAIMGCHSTNGDFATYPLVISEQEHGVCKRIKGPAISLGVNARFETLAVQYASALAKALPLYGAFGIELFETPDGDLWVNEIAPRVHNSGHYTQDACRTSQFENHLRALTGQILGQTETEPFFVMLNLLGPQGIQGKIHGSLPAPPPGTKLHWYNKAEVFPGRKMGHLGWLGKNPEQLTEGLALMENYERHWAEKLADQTVDQAVERNKS